VRAHEQSSCAVLLLQRAVRFRLCNACRAASAVTTASFSSAARCGTAARPPSPTHARPRPRIRMSAAAGRADALRSAAAAGSRDRAPICSAGHGAPGRSRRARAASADAVGICCSATCGVPGVEERRGGAGVRRRGTAARGCSAGRARPARAAAVRTGDPAPDTRIASTSLPCVCALSSSPVLYDWSLVPRHGAGTCAADPSLSQMPGVRCGPPAACIGG
jgi:hypothetical protein